MKNVLFLIFLGTQVCAQGIDYNKIILPEHVQTSDFAEKLVRLAWKNHPNNDAVRRRVEIAEREISKSSAAWLDMVLIQGNLNEFNLNPTADIQNRSDFFPRYNFGLRVPLGLFMYTPALVKQNRQQLLISQDEVSAQKLEVRRQVLQTYNDYVLAENIYRLQSQQFTDAESAMKLIEQRFKNGEATFDNYTASQANFNRVSIQLLQAERDFKNVKLDLEQLIGVRLEDVK
ncbi:MAG: TolC family protein [Cyclobacteriaceae bacterium]|nr:TolC family protein [Cyclobacteriaceae bacterium]